MRTPRFPTPWTANQKIWINQVVYGPVVVRPPTGPDKMLQNDLGAHFAIEMKLKTEISRHVYKPMQK